MRRLTETEILGYHLVSPATARRARVQRVPFLAPGFCGMTLGRLILVLRDDDRSGRRALLAHELVHVEQCARLGAARFLWSYVVEYARNRRRGSGHRQAYAAVSFEVEARAAAARWRTQSTRGATAESPA